MFFVIFGVVVLVLQLAFGATHMWTTGRVPKIVERRARTLESDAHPPACSISRFATHWCTVPGRPIAFGLTVGDHPKRFGSEARDPHAFEQHATRPTRHTGIAEQENLTFKPC